MPCIDNHEHKCTSCCHAWKKRNHPVCVKCTTVKCQFQPYSEWKQIKKCPKHNSKNVLWPGVCSDCGHDQDNPSTPIRNVPCVKCGVVYPTITEKGICESIHKERGDWNCWNCETFNLVDVRICQKCGADKNGTFTSYSNGKEGVIMNLKEIRTLNKMLVALVDLLEEKGILTHEEWDDKVKQELEETKGLKKL